ncbi:hypothetical protein PMAYCL1PPCAC_22546, partial [Pristionchus mayeri]
EMKFIVLIFVLIGGSIGRSPFSMSIKGTLSCPTSFKFRVSLWDSTDLDPYAEERQDSPKSRNYTVAQRHHHDFRISEPAPESSGVWLDQYFVLTIEN